jgi:acyl-CoA oxidase
LNNIVLLYAANVVRKNLAWYLLHSYISNTAAGKLNDQINELIKHVGKHSMEICEAFGIPKELVYAPIYTGYEEYYKSDITNGEHYNVKMRPKF